MATHAIPIDPILLAQEAPRSAEDSVATPVLNGASTQMGDAASSSRVTTLPPAAGLSLDASTYPRLQGETRSQYDLRLTNVTRIKAPLLAACASLGLPHPKSATLERLRTELAKYWFPSPESPSPASRIQQDTRPSAHPSARPIARPTTPIADIHGFQPPATPYVVAPPRGHRPAPTAVQHRGELRGGVQLVPPAASSSHTGAHRSVHASALLRVSVGTSRAPIQRRLSAANEEDDDDSDDDEPDDDAELIEQYDVEGANGADLLGYDDSEDESEEEDPSDEEAAHDAFKRSVRVKAVRRAEGNRRPHGIRTQKSMVKAWDDFKAMALQRKKIKDGIVDEHALLLFIEHSAEREKLTQRGLPIPGTRLGASQLKKLFFGALRVRKPQDAADPTLAQKRPAATFIVWEAIKNRMDEALERVRNGLDETEDAPDIRANTFLPEVTAEQLQKIGYGFLAHRQVRLSVFGHLAWTAQHASGNRGDDFRALKLAELQPYEMQHPVYDTTFFSVLGLQGEEKAGRRGMRTIVNPSYTVFIAHKSPEMCPFGAFAFYHHYIHDEKKITESLKIDWTRNSSWRGVRILHGPKSPVTPYSDQNLYNLYCRAYTAAGFTSRLKAHLPRHLLGYRQEEQRVDPVHTSKLGWKRNETYFDTYAPALPKQAVLGAAGYKATEEYDPVWRKVTVPPQFLRFICPMAEDIRQSIKDARKDNLSGADHYWEMVIALRPYAFLCGAAIFQKCPRSSLFRLPAFTDRDVRNWMKTTFPADLTLLQAGAGSAPDLVAIQNTILRQALENLYRVVGSQEQTIRELLVTIQRRTAVLSPTQGFSMGSYQRQVARFSSPPSTPSALPSTSAPTTPPIVIHLDEQLEQTGTYHTLDTSVRAFVNSSPKSPGIPRAPTEVDLVLPPTEAFFKKGAPRGIVPPLFGQKSACWPDVFALIQQPKFCWAVWGPSKSVDKFSSVREMWTLWIDGEVVLNNVGVQTGKKPPLQLVERYMQARWRTPDDPKERVTVAQHWGRYREIPEWIERESSRRGISPDVIIAELDAMRTVGGKTKGLNWLRQEVERLRKQAKQQSVQTGPVASTSSLSVVDAPQPNSLGPAFQEDTQSCNWNVTTPTTGPSPSSPGPDMSAANSLAPQPAATTTLGSAFQEAPVQPRKRAAPIDARRQPGKKLKL